MITEARIQEIIERYNSEAIQELIAAIRELQRTVGDEDYCACPHCGVAWPNDLLRDDKRVPLHGWPQCPGTGLFPVALRSQQSSGEVLVSRSAAADVADTHTHFYTGRDSKVDCDCGAWIAQAIRALPAKGVEEK